MVSKLATKGEQAVLTFDIPARGVLKIKNVVFDFNGTMAVDGRLVPGLAQRLEALARQVRVHVITADTFGSAAQACREMSCTLTVLPENPIGPHKARLVESLGAAETAAFGNGANDAAMLAAAGLSVVVIGSEGAAVETLLAADVAVREINDGVDLLLRPGRLVATLRR